MFYCFSSYSTLLELHYGRRVTRSRVAQDQVKGMGISIRETECQTDIGLFLDEYPQWELGIPHWSVILHKMFLHAANRGQKEAALWDQIHRQVHLLWSWWDIRHPVRKFKTSIKVFACYEDYQVFPVVGMSRERR